MATIKLTMENRHPYNDGRYPIIFRLTTNQKSSSIYTEIKLYKSEWDNLKGKVTKLHPNSNELNLKIKKQQYELEKKLLELGSSIDDLTVKDLKEALLNEKKTAKITFYEFAVKEIQDQRDQERYGNADSYETAVNRLVKFTGKSILLYKITYTVISDFDIQLIKEGLSRNSVAVYMREIRALLNKAIKKELLDKNNYAFSNFKIKTEKTVSRAITKNHLEKIKSFPLEEGSKFWHCRNIFFLIFNLIGISFIDLALLKHSSLQNGRVVYKRRKTGKIYSIKLTPDAQRILNIYRNEGGKYLISYLSIDEVSKEEERDAIHLKLHVCNEHLKILGKKLELPISLTTYVARYTWANVAKSLGFSKDLIAEALGHNYGNSVTGIYLDNYGNDVIDQMNEKVTAMVNIS